LAEGRAEGPGVALKQPVEPSIISDFELYGNKASKATGNV
jgi:hypothetical protein